MARVNSNAIAMTHSTEEVGYYIRVWHASPTYLVSRERERERETFFFVFGGGDNP